MIIRHSMIEQYLSCHRKFYEVHIVGNRDKETSSALSFGSAVHTAMQAHFEGDDCFRAFNLYWDSDENQKLEDWHTLKLLANEKFLPKFLKGPAKRMQNIKTEITMQAPILGDHILQGTLDWVGEIDGEFTLGDWKTSKSQYYPAKVQKSLQMYIYAYLYEKTFGRLPDFLRYIVFVKSDGSIQGGGPRSSLKVRLTKDLLASRMNIVENIVKDIVGRIARESEKPKECWYPNPTCFCAFNCFPLGEENK